VHRESDRHSPREDDTMKAELQGNLQGNGPTRADQSRDPELPADDESDVPPLGGGA